MDLSGVKTGGVACGGGKNSVKGGGSSEQGIKWAEVEELEVGAERQRQTSDVRLMLWCPWITLAERFVHSQNMGDLFQT